MIWWLLRRYVGCYGDMLVVIVICWLLRRCCKLKGLPASAEDSRVRLRVDTRVPFSATVTMSLFSGSKV